MRGITLIATLLIGDEGHRDAGVDGPPDDADAAVTVAAAPPMALVRFSGASTLAEGAASTGTLDRREASFEKPAPGAQPGPLRRLGARVSMTG